MIVFVDTSALYALMDADDRNHERARDAWAQWLDQPVQFLTSNYVYWRASRSYSTGSAARLHASSRRS